MCRDFEQQWRNPGLKERPFRIEKKLNEAILPEQNLERMLQDRTERFHKLQNNYEPLQLKAAYPATQSTLETNQGEVQRLTEENGGLKSSQREELSATGALVILFGLLIGLVMGRQQKRYGSSFYS